MTDRPQTMFEAMAEVNAAWRELWHNASQPLRVALDWVIALTHRSEP